MGRDRHSMDALAVRSGRSASKFKAMLISEPKIRAVFNVARLEILRHNGYE